MVFAGLWRPSGEEAAALREMLQGLDIEAGLDRLLELARAADVLPPGVGKPWLRERFDQLRRNLKTVDGYLPRPYGGRVTLFRAGASLAPGATDLTSGWIRLARTEAHLIPDADHFSLLRGTASTIWWSTWKALSPPSRRNRGAEDPSRASTERSWAATEESAATAEPSADITERSQATAEPS